MASNPGEQGAFNEGWPASQGTAVVERVAIRRALAEGCGTGIMREGRQPKLLYPVIEDTLMFGGILLVGSRLETQPRSPWWLLADGYPDLAPALFARDAEEEGEEEDEEDDADEDFEDLDDLDDEDLDEDLGEDESLDEEDDEDEDEDEDEEEPAAD